MEQPRLLIRGALLAMIVLAGCLAGPAQPPMSPQGPHPDPVHVLVPPSEVGRYFSPEVKVADKRNGEGENFVTVSDDGLTVLECMHGEFVQTPMMLASTDGGATFRELTLDAPSTGGDCEDTIGEGGRWFWVHSTVVGATVVSTADQGRTWITSRVTAVPTNGLADRPWIATAGKSVFLTYAPVWYEPGTVGWVKSNDEGRTWSAPRTLTTVSAEKFSVYVPKMLVSRDNQNVRVPYFTYPRVLANQEVAASTQGWFQMLVSHDRGETWIDEPVMGPVPDYVRTHTTAALAGNDTLYWAYMAQNGTTWEARVIVSLDDGKTWSEPTLVFGGFKALGLPLMDGRPDGSATLILQGDGAAANPQGAGNWVVVVRLDARSPRLVQWVLPLSEGGGEFSSVDHDGSGTAYVGFLRGNSLWLSKEIDGSVRI